MNTANWERHFDTTRNCFYYYNTSSGQTTWDKPEEFNEEKTNNQKSSIIWRQYIDEATGKAYFVNSIDNRTQWEIPQDGEIEVIESHTACADNSANTANESNHEPISAWARYVDTKTGIPYYFNTVTQVTQWNEPAQLQCTVNPSADIIKAADISRVREEYDLYQSKKEQEKLAEMTKQTLDPQGHIEKLSSVLDRIDQNIVVRNETDEAKLDDSVVEWQQHVDPHTQNFYYYNKLTGARQWERPDGQIQSALADWIPPETHKAEPLSDPDGLVDGTHYIATAKFNQVTGKYERMGGEEYWNAVGVATDRSGRQMSHFFDLKTLEENRAKAMIIKNKLRTKNINWKKFKAEKKLKRQKLRNKWLLED